MRDLDEVVDALAQSRFRSRQKLASQDLAYLESKSLADESNAPD